MSIISNKIKEKKIIILPNLIFTEDMPILFAAQNAPRSLHPHPLLYLAID